MLLASLLMIECETLKKEEEQAKKDERIKPKSNSNPKWIWQKKVALPLEGPLRRHHHKSPRPQE